MTIHFRYLVVFLSRFLLFPLYACSRLLPRRETLWLFGSWGGYRYADNAAAFFRYCNREHGGDLDLVWISRRRSIVRDVRAGGYRAEWLYSVAGIAACLRAGCYLFDCFAKDINFWTSGGARLVNLWSGVPLKTFERDIDQPSNRYFRLFHGHPVERFLYAMMMPWHQRRPDRIIALSAETAEITRRAFDLAPEQVLVTGFPRNDALFSPSGHTVMPPSLQAALDNGQRALLYLPTFRDSGKPFLRIDWDRLNTAMQDLNAVFFCKFHPVDANDMPVDRSHVKGLPQDIDVYALLPRADVLISDYSSIIFDYMLLNRPVVYYAPDIESFVSENRSLNFDPLEIAVGPVCRNFDALLAALQDEVTGLSETAEIASPGDRLRRERIYERLHRYRDDGSCRRVFDALTRDAAGAPLTPLPGTGTEGLQRSP